jgi:Fic family protein
MLDKSNILAKLPPNIEYKPLIRVIGEAHGALGELNGLLLKNVLNPELLMTPLLTKEAVLSSRIEGTQATLEDVFHYEARSEEKKLAKDNDIKEIINYRRVLNFSLGDLKDSPINQEFIKKVHYYLLDSVRGSDKDRGNFRKGKVFIGSPGVAIEEASYVPPESSLLPSLMNNWEDYINSNLESDLLVQAGIAHYQLEAIHPFRDGNGRVGRLLIPLFLYKREILSAPMLYISEYFERNRRDYYDLLKGVTERAEWNEWLKFFLLALITESLKTRASVLKIMGLYERSKKSIVAANSVYAIDLLDLIFESPVISYVKIKDKLKTKNPQTIYNLIGKFSDLRILYEEPGRKRNRVFVFKELVEILNH